MVFVYSFTGRNESLMWQLVEHCTEKNERGLGSIVFRHLIEEDMDITMMRRLKMHTWRLNASIRLNDMRANE